MVNTSTAGEDRGHRIGIPVDERLVTRRVDIPHHLLHDVTVVDGNIIEGLWDIGEGIDPNFICPVPPGEVGNVFEISLFFDRSGGVGARASPWNLP